MDSKYVREAISSKIEYALALTVMNSCMNKNIQKIKSKLEQISKDTGINGLTGNTRDFFKPTSFSVGVEINKNDPEQKLYNWFDSGLTNYLEMGKLIDNLAKQHAHERLYNIPVDINGRLDIKKKFNEKYPTGIAGFASNVVVDTIDSRLDAALALSLIKDRYRIWKLFPKDKEKDITLINIIKEACTSNDITGNMLALLHPTAISLLADGKINPNNPNVKIWNALNGDGEIAKDLKTLIKALAVECFEDWESEI